MTLFILKKIMIDYRFEFKYFIENIFILKNTSKQCLYSYLQRERKRLTILSNINIFIFNYHF